MGVRGPDVHRVWFDFPDPFGRCDVVHGTEDCLGPGVAGGEQRDVVSPRHELLREEAHDLLDAAVPGRGDGDPDWGDDADPHDRSLAPELGRGRARVSTKRDVSPRNPPRGTPRPARAATGPIRMAAA